MHARRLVPFSQSTVVTGRIAALFVLLAATSQGAAPSPAPADPKTITTAPGELGDLLRQWHEEGTAAGNDGDWYDNRDGGHSDLDTSTWPQLQRIAYTDEDRAANRHWAAQSTVLPKVVFGNSSTSAGVHQGGSNVRQYYAHPNGLPFLYAQYTHNNLYIYPEHLDHDPGRNGAPPVGGYGDLYPTNTPCLIASQGSSGSDQPFMRAIPFTLAAFRPEVKKRLVETGLLMPTVQMIFRATNKHLGDDAEAAKGAYLTGKAHPTVFEGGWVDELKMARLAHEIQLDTIPPIVQLKVVGEDAATAGQDFFEAGGGEKLADTPAVVARVFRAAAPARKIVVSAEPSYDVNKRPLTFHWALLRGDEKTVLIKPVNEAGSVVEIIVGRPERRPVAEGSPLEANRVDIGAFVHNGAYHSAPAFVTFFGLDNESRTHDDKGRLLEVGYGHGEASLAVGDWPALFDALQANPPAPGVALLRSRFSEGALSEILKAREQYAAQHAHMSSARDAQRKAQASLDESAAALQAAEEALAAAKTGHATQATPAAAAAVSAAEAKLDALKQARPGVEEALRAANDVLHKANQAAEEVLARPREALGASVRSAVEGKLTEAANTPAYAAENAAALGGLLDAATEDAGRAARATRQRLVHLDIAAEHQQGIAWDLRPLRPGDTPAGVRLTAYEKAQVARAQAELLAGLALPGLVTAAWRENFVDFRITAPKHWRDVYRYNDSGTRLGWTRYFPDAPAADFDADGFMVLERDGLGRRVRAKAVRYERRREGEGFPLKMVEGDQILHYAYADDADRKGQVTQFEAVKEPGK